MKHRTSSTSGPDPVDKRRRDFGIIGRALQDGAADFVSLLPLRRGQRFLDVCCGTGIVSIPAARAGGDVTGVDPREPFLSRGRAWAKNEDLLIRFKPAGAERLPFSDGNFHAVVNFMGLPFTDDPAAACAEMLRVCRARGLLAAAAWEPESAVGDMLRTTYRYSGDSRLLAALEWCEPEALRGLLAGTGRDAAIVKRRAKLAFPLAPADVAEYFLAFYPPVSRAADALEPDARRALGEELSSLWQGVGEATSEVDVDYRAVIAKD